MQLNLKRPFISESARPKINMLLLFPKKLLNTKEDLYWNTLYFLLYPRITLRLWLFKHLIGLKSMPNIVCKKYALHSMSPEVVYSSISCNKYQKNFPDLAHLGTSTIKNPVLPNSLKTYQCTAFIKLLWYPLHHRRSFKTPIPYSLYLHKKNIFHDPH